MSKYLNRSILSTLAIFAVAGAFTPDSAALTFDTIDVPGYGGICYDVTCRSAYGDWGDWDYNPGEDDGSGGFGDVGDPPPPPACLELMNTGLPEGCDRNLAGSGTPFPQFSQPSELQWLFADGPNGLMSEKRAGSANYNLSICYANVSITPKECETQYYNAIVEIYNGVQLSAQQAQWLQSALANLRNRFAITESNRGLYGFFGNDSFGISMYSFSVGSSFLSSFFIVDQYNKALISSRKQKLCDIWYRVWDSNDCTAHST